MMSPQIHALLYGRRLTLLFQATTVVTLLLLGINVYHSYRHGGNMKMINYNSYGDEGDESLDEEWTDVENLDPYSIYPLSLRASRATKHGQPAVDRLGNWKELDQCFVSSTSIVNSMDQPPCESAKDFLESASFGGRLGTDATYRARGCSIWWHNTQEVCDVFEQYAKIWFVGDELLENVFGGLMMIIRQDANYGAMKTWDFRDLKDMSCGCQHSVDDSYCAELRVKDIDQVIENDYPSINCYSRELLATEMIPMSQDPVSQEVLDMLKQRLEHRSSYQAGDSKPIAVIYGLGHSVNNDVGRTLQWLQNVHQVFLNSVPESIPIKELFITSGATGPQIPDDQIFDRGVKATQEFENKIRAALSASDSELQIPVLGFWNATVQTSFSADGAHNTVEVNLLKAMMVINWLEMNLPN
ncbi:uncharacterized protein V1516DRAFT_668594 [Lipomyces oligophaga]|uniref:uncharacterized protein n=1 Tax=Lipomyces oligophaga TaxID=45792 RepID=UPI0034CEF185